MGSSECPAKVAAQFMPPPKKTVCQEARVWPKNAVASCQQSKTNKV